jgi:predicted transcriptional regulator
MPIKITHVYLALGGIAMFLGGETQSAVYLAVLARPSANIHIIQRYIEVYHGKTIAYTTVATLANRLCDKGILKRSTDPDKAKREYTYTALITSDDLIAYATDLTLKALDRVKDTPNV